jgi:hypothetical protein
MEKWVLIAVLFGPVITALGVAGAMLLVMQRQERHLLAVLDRFLSRSFGDYAMVDVAKRALEGEEEIEGGLSPDEEEQERVIEAYLDTLRQSSPEVTGR